MSQAPLKALETGVSDNTEDFRVANARQVEMVRDGVSQSGYERNCAYLNTGATRFANISAAAGLDHIGDGRAYALSDWDHDGDLDIWATNRTSPRVQFLRNNSPANNHFLAVKLVGNGTSTNRDAIGARVEVVLKNQNSEIKNQKSIKTLRAGEGFLAQSTKWLHFGLGADDQIERLIVHWPGGDREEFVDLLADRQFVVEQGSGKAVPWSRSAPAAELAESKPLAPAASQAARIPLRYRIPMPPLEYRTFDGETRVVGEEATGPILVNLWATWCRPCLKELVDFRSHQVQFDDAGVNLIALSVDQLAEDAASNPEAARDILQRQEFPFLSGFATPDLVGKIEAAFYYLFDFRRPWAVPTSLLFDESGQLAVIYIGPVGVEQLLADVGQLAADERVWLDSSLPFAGRWSGDLRHPNLRKYIETYFDRGFQDNAFQLAERFDHLLKSDPEYPKLLVRLAQHLQMSGATVQAKKKFLQLLKLAPNNATAHMELSKLYYAEGNKTDALKHAEAALRLDPNHALAHSILGVLLLEQGYGSEAVEHFEKLVELQPEMFDARLRLGAAYGSVGRRAAAIEQFHHATLLRPQSDEAHYQLAKSLAGAKRYDEAVAAYQQAIEIAPQRAGLHFGLGIALEGAGRAVESVEAFRRTLELKPDSLAAGNSLAWMLSTTDQVSPADVAEAVQLAEAIAERSQHGHPQILDTLAAAYAAAGDYAKAVETAQSAVRLAQEMDAPNLASQIGARLELYRSGRPYRQANAASESRNGSTN